MKVIQSIAEKGGELQLTDVEDISPGDKQVKIAVKAAGINRADLMQRKGNYPPPPGASEIMGLEVSGEIAEIGAGVTKFHVGDEVMALLAGGGYAEFAVVDQGSVMRVPKGLNFVEAAGIPEVFLTAYQAMFLLGDLDEGETILIHAGASGVGTAAIQLAKSIGATVIVTAGSYEKIDFCKKLGADHGINYRKDRDFDRLVKLYTNNKGTDVIIDFIGADYMESNINAAALDGRIVMLALMGGARAKEVNLGKILMKRIKFMGSTLRARSEAYKTDLVDQFQTDFLKSFEQKQLKPIVDSVYPWNKTEEAHQRMEQNLNMGKIVIEVGRE